MKTLPPLLTGILFGAVFFTSALNAEEPKTVKCDPIFKKVETEVSAEPDKVLMIVEKAIRTNEECVCEVIKAAVLATKASDELTKQIMLTALNTAPQKAKEIEVCIAAIVAERSKVKKGGKDVEDVVVRSGKDGKEVVFSEKGVMDPAPVSGPDDYRVLPPDIRGVYLIQPAAGGVFFSDPRTVIVYRDRRPRVVVRRTPPTTSIPQSPSTAALVAAP